MNDRHKVHLLAPFIAQARHHPKAVALITPEGRISFGVLRRRAKADRRDAVVRITGASTCSICPSSLVGLMRPPRPADDKRRAVQRLPNHD